jgi:hypothetical protein
VGFLFLSSKLWWKGPYIEAQVKVPKRYWQMERRGEEKMKPFGKNGKMNVTFEVTRKEV